MTTHSATEANVTRLLFALEYLDAYYRFQPDRKLRPLDLLGTIGKGHTYSDLIPFTVPLTIAPKCSVAVFDLATLIEVKEETAGEKDRAVLPILRRTLEEKSRS